MSKPADMDKLLSRFAKETVPGCACMVMQNGEKLYENYFGYGDIENKVPVSDNSLFRLFSMTKVIVCTAAMIQFERGEFLMTDPYYEYFPEYKNSKVAKVASNGRVTFRDAASPILVNHTFNMTCGLPYPSEGGEHPTDAAMNRIHAEMEAKGKYTLQDDIRAMSEVPLLFDPGEHRVYGFGHEMVGGLIEVTSGKTLGEFLKENIFDPLGMKHTSYRYTEETKDDLVKWYMKRDDGSYVDLKHPFDEKHKPDAIYEGGGAGLISNLEDYAIFTQMLANGGTYNGERILGRKTIDLMRTNMLNEMQFKEFDNGPCNHGYGYGLGVRTMVDPSGHSNSPFGEFGWTGAAGTWTSIDPDDKFSVVYFHNMYPNEEVYHHLRVRSVAYGMME